VRFDFDEWRRLAQADPEAFERRRREVVEALIARAPRSRQARLKGLQFRIDLERRKADSPLAAALRLQEMLAAQLQELAQALERLGACETSRPTPPQRRSATVLPLEPRR
jgi:hypothetical protein